MLLLLLSACLHVPNSEAATARPVQILKSDATGVTLEVTAHDLSVSELSYEGRRLIRLEGGGAPLHEEEGKPEIPYQVAHIGIPLQGSVSLAVLETDQQALDDVELIPTPAFIKVDGWSEADLVFDSEVYGSAQPYPAERVTLGQPEFFRDQRMVRLEVAMAQYLPQQKRVVQIERVVIRLEFSGAARTQTRRVRPTSPNEEELYQNILLNYAQAADWRKERQLPKRSATVSGLQDRALYKFTVSQEGMYKIDGRFLEDNNIDLNSVDPARIQLFNNGGRELARHIDDARPSGLVENAILLNDGGDGSFDQNDSIVFYARGAEGWYFDVTANRYRHYIHRYALENVYWLSLGGSESGKRMLPLTSSQSPGPVVDTYQGLYFVEDELQNPLQSGMNWFGENFAVNEFDATASLTLDLPNAGGAGNSRWHFQFAALNPGAHQFTMNMNGNSVGSTSFNGTVDVQGGASFVKINMRNVSFDRSETLLAGSNTLVLSYSHSSTSGQAFLDWLELEYPARLRAVDNQALFNVVPATGFQTYRVSNFTDSSIELFDVTDFANVRRIVDAETGAGGLTFTDFQQAEAPKRYIALSTSKYRTPASLTRSDFTDVRNPDLAAEFIIITHEDFLSEALRLESYRENGSPNNRLSTQVIPISDIYDNFSSGMMDAPAIRDFLKYAYDNWSPRPLYVLLFGDGDYDYKNLIDATDSNWIPTFQTDLLVDENFKFLRELDSRTSDAWFTYMESRDYPGGGSRFTPTMEMAIGRLNVQTLQEAKITIDKIIDYESRPLRGNWRNTITVVGDDELVNGGRPSSIDVIHIRDAEKLADSFIPSNFELKKIYLSEFPKVASAATGGVSKPRAKEALLNQINLGSLILHYIGHGNSTLWAHEAVFEESDNDRVQNLDKLMFIVAATCDWALYDRPARTSQAEALLLAERRGAVAMLSSARLVFASTNANFSQDYYTHLFSETGRTARIGDAFVAARIDNRARVNDEKYHIYGDPTLRLAMPEQEAVITSMTPDSIVALTTVVVEGEVRRDGQLVSDFDGTASVSVFDSEKNVRNVPEAGGVQVYDLPGNSIFRGDVPVRAGKFHARFIVPKDISYGGRLARVLTYFWNEETDGFAYRNNITVSSQTGTLVDGEGPQIRIFFRGNESFTSGDIVDDDVTMVVDIADTVSGVNIAGEIGHRMTLTLDPEEETCLSEKNRFQGVSNIDLTDLFKFNEGDHLRGTVEIPLQFPEEVEIGGRTVRCAVFGEEQRHTLQVKAWDNSNNSSTTAVEVVVVQQDGLVVERVLNYPNPFRETTTFTFFLTQDADVEIKIYTVSGQLIQTVEYMSAARGFNMVEWDGRDAQGDVPANGVYLYKLIAKGQGSDGPIQKETIRRLAIVR